MRKLSFMKTACVAALALSCVWAVAGCSSGEPAKSARTGGVAATVNGTEIAEDDVTDAVEEARARLSLTDEDAWGQWMADNNYTPESVREEFIDTLVSQEIIRQAAAERDITVDSEEIQTYVSTMRDHYDSDQAWEEALAAVGLTEDEYCKNIEFSLLSSRLSDEVAADAEPDQATMLSYAQMMASSYNGAKRSSHILFDADDEATAQDVLNRINSGQLDFAEAAKQYSKDTGSATNGGDVGWDCLANFVTEYTDGLTPLAPGQVSGLVPSSFGIHIIKCTDQFVAPEEVTSTDQLPTEFVDTIRNMVASTSQSSAYTSWVEEQKTNAEIVINDMPEGLPYWVDMSNFESSTTAQAVTDNTNAAVDANLATESGETVVQGENATGTEGTEPNQPAQEQQTTGTTGGTATN